MSYRIARRSAPGLNNRSLAFADRRFALTPEPLRPNARTTEQIATKNFFIMSPPPLYEFIRKVSLLFDLQLVQKSHTAPTMQIVAVRAISGFTDRKLAQASTRMSV